MATTEELLISINASKTAIKASIEAKGVTVGTAPLADYATKIGLITTSYDATNINNTITPYSDWSTPSKLPDPATIPANYANKSNFSPDGKFLCVCSDTTSPVIAIYSVSGTTFTKLSDPGTLPTGSAKDCAWSGDGRFLAVTHSTTPFVTVYERSGTTFTKLTNPATLPAVTTTVGGCAWSNDGRFLSVAHDASPYVTIYERTGTTLTKLTNPGTLPTNAAKDCSWSPDGTQLAVGHLSSPYITIYSRSGTTFTKVSNPATLPVTFGEASPGISGSVASCNYSPDGAFLVTTITSGALPRITIYQVSGTTYTINTSLTTLAGASKDCAWSSNSKYLAVALASSPYLQVYSVSGTTFTSVTNPVSGPGTSTSGSGITWSPDGKFLALSTSNIPRINIYQTTATAPTTSGKTASIVYKAFTEA